MVDGATKGNDFQVIGSKFRAVLFPPRAGQSIKPFTGQQCREEAVFCYRWLLGPFIAECILMERPVQWPGSRPHKVATEVIVPAETRVMGKPGSGVPVAAWC